MKLYKKIDNYLLHHYPNIWVTRIHVFLPIALIITALIYIVNVYFIGWDLKQDLPNISGIPTLIIPTLIFLVTWFVYQSRYNVEKSGGKLSIFGEYLNYFLYFLVFSSALLLVTSVNYSNDAKVAKKINNKEFIQDIKNLNIGNSVMNNPGELKQLGNGNYLFPNKLLVDQADYGFYLFRSGINNFNTQDNNEFGFENSFHYNNEVSYYVISKDKSLFEKNNNYSNTYHYNKVDLYPKILVYDTVKYFENNINNKKYSISKKEFDIKISNNEIIKYKKEYFKNSNNEYRYGEEYKEKYYYKNEFTEVTKAELINIIKNYTKSYNKFVTNNVTIEEKPEKVIEYNLTGISISNLYVMNNNEYQDNDEIEYDSYNYNSYYKVDYVENKLEDLLWVYGNNHNAFIFNYISGGIYKVFLFFLLYLALLVWIFKQIFWRSYMFGIIALALTPMVLGIFSFLFYQIFREQIFSIGFVLFLYFLVTIKVIMGYQSPKKNKSAIVFTMYLQFFLPVLPMLVLSFVRSIYMDYDSYDYSWFETGFEYMYWLGLSIGLLSLIVFKPIYKKMSLLPNNK